ncbi:hypothetical protein [Endothiovibrio diazotrophicus]
MDLLDFDTTSLYFDDPLPQEAAELIDRAAADYHHDEEGGETSELLLLRAYLAAPTHLAVLVALYRFYYYSHRLEETLTTAQRAMEASGNTLGFPADWREVDDDDLHRAVMRAPMGLIRFYLSTLKATGYLNLRLQRIELAREQLRKVMSLDTADRLGAGALLGMIERVPRAVT